MNIVSMSFDWKSDGFGVPCDLCKKENATNQISGEQLSGIDGTYCDECHKIVCKKASDFYKKEFKKQTKDLKSTVLFRRHGGWSMDEMNLLSKSLCVDDIWFDLKKTRYLVIEGHHKENVVAQALSQISSPYRVTHVVGIDDKRLPFPPFS